METKDASIGDTTMDAADNRTQAFGIGLVVASAVFFSLSGVFTKLVAADVWTVACWRGLIGAVLITLYAWSRGGLAYDRADLGLGWRGLVLASVGSAATLAFIAAFKLTFVANVAIIYATVPFMAAALEFLFRGVPIRRAVVLATTVSLFGVGIMVMGGLGTGNWLGDAIAVLMTFGNALYMVLIRLFRDTPVVLAAALSSLQLFALGWVFSDPLAVTAADAMVLILFGTSFAAAVILWTEGTRLISAAESGLLGSAEVPLAILFAWLILADIPPAMSLVGGAIVLIAVFSLAWRDFSSARAS